MSYREEVKLGDLIKIKHGYAFKGAFITKEPTRNILVTPGNFNIGGGFKSKKFKYYNGEIPQDYILKKDDIIVTMTDLSKSGDTLGYSAKVPNRKEHIFLHNQRIGLVLFKQQDLQSKDYIYWLLRTQHYQNFIVNTATGTSVKHTSPTRIYEYKLQLPPLKTQNRIASILSAFDEKIELNRQMNATLEAMAQAMFREMCLPDDVEELEEGWEWRKIGDIGVNKRQTVKKEDITEDDNYIGLEHVPRKQIAIDNWNDASNVKSNKYRFSKNDILFGKLRPYFHKIGVVPVDGVCSTDILVIQPKREEYFGFLLMHCFSDELVSEVNASSSGTRMPRTNWKALARYEIALPPIEIIKEFNHQIIDFVAKMNANTLENQALAKSRDLLLPKLMSGEIEV